METFLSQPAEVDVMWVVFCRGIYGCKVMEACDQEVDSEALKATGGVAHEEGQKEYKSGGIGLGVVSSK